MRSTICPLAMVDHPAGTNEVGVSDRELRLLNRQQQQQRSASQGPVPQVGLDNDTLLASMRSMMSEMFASYISTIQHGAQSTLF